MDTPPPKKKTAPVKITRVFLFGKHRAPLPSRGEFQIYPTGNLWATHNAKISTFSTAVRCEKVESTIRQC